MDTETNPTTGAGRRKAGRLYHHVDCRHLTELRIQITEEGRKDPKAFAFLGVSSKETIRTGFRMVDVSPFKTVFVVDEESGRVLFALSRNEEYVKAARKKNPPPPPPPPPPPTSFCCQECYRNGGYACSDYPDGSCLCSGANQGGGSLDDQLETLAF
jgi:hypothetical protein